MTNYVAAWLAGLLALFVAGDLLLNDGQILLFLTQKFMDLLHWVEFWR